MAEERVNEQGANPPDEFPVDVRRSGGLEDLTPPSAYEILMKQHRDAILRITALETENQNLMNMLKQALSGQPQSYVNQPAASTDELLARIQALEGRNGPAPAFGGRQTARSDPSRSAEKSSVSSIEIEQLRVQNQTLSGQVSRLDRELEALKSERRHRRHRKSSRDQKRGLLSRIFQR